MNPWVQFGIDGLSLGAVYALVALGYCLVWGMLRMLYLAQPAVIALGAWMASLLARNGPSETLGGGMLLLAAVTICSAGIGLAIERLVYRPVREAPPLNGLLAGLAVTLLTGSCLHLFSGAGHGNSALDFISSLHASGPLAVDNGASIVLLIATLLLLGYLAIAYRTGLGTAVRAYALNRTVARLVGINEDAVIPFAFALASGLAGAAGALQLLQGAAVEPWVGILPGLAGLAAALAGGMNRQRRVLGAAVGLGIADCALAASELGAWRAMLPLIVIVVMLVLRPRRRMGRPVSESP